MVRIRIWPESQLTPLILAPSPPLMSSLCPDRQGGAGGSAEVSGLSHSVCPSCGCQTGRVHGHYVRRLADMPW